MSKVKTHMLDGLTREDFDRILDGLTGDRPSVYARAGKMTAKPYYAVPESDLRNLVEIARDHLQARDDDVAGLVASCRAFAIQQPLAHTEVAKLLNDAADALIAKQVGLAAERRARREVEAHCAEVAGMLDPFRGDGQSDIRKLAHQNMEEKKAAHTEIERLHEALEFYSDPMANAEYKCINGHDRCYIGSSPDCPYCERPSIPDFYDEMDFGKCARIALGKEE